MTLRKSPRILLVILTAVTVISLPRRLAAQGTEDKPIVSAAATAKFSAIPTAPACFAIAVERGDPSAGASVLLARFAPGCVAPFHWHTPSETAMLVSGSLEVQMKDDKAFVAHHGDYVYLPGHHVHRATCTSTARPTAVVDSRTPRTVSQIAPTVSARLSGSHAGSQEM